MSGCVRLSCQVGLNHDKKETGKKSLRSLGVLQGNLDGNKYLQDRLSEERLERTRTESHTNAVFSLFNTRCQYCSLAVGLIIL